MFEINNQYRIQSALPIITDNYKVLHFDEFPILFSGINKFTNKIIGSFSYENEDNDYFRYFSIIVDDAQYYDFFNKRKSYLELINESQEVFVVDKDINDIVLNIYHLPLSTIPVDYLPLSNSYIPEQNVIVSLNFGFSLKGKLADYHKAFVNDINNVNQKIYAYLDECLETFSNLELRPIIYSQPSQISSYRLNFDIEFQKDVQLKLFPINQDKLNEFIADYLNYVAYVLPNESDDFLNAVPDESQNFQNLKQRLVDVYSSGGIQLTTAFTDNLIESINNSANKLSDVTEYLKTNESFSTIELGNYNESGTFSSIGYLTDNYKSDVASKLLVDDLQLLEENEVESDATPQDYRILVYKLNRYTGKGGARLYYDNSENYHTIRLYIEMGEHPLSNTIYTKSLDEDKVVDVKGIAIRVNGVYKKLECYL